MICLFLIYLFFPVNSLIHTLQIKGGVGREEAGGKGWSSIRGCSAFIGGCVRWDVFFSLKENRPTFFFFLFFLFPGTSDLIVIIDRIVPHVIIYVDRTSGPGGGEGWRRGWRIMNLNTYVYT